MRTLKSIQVLTLRVKYNMTNERYQDYLHLIGQLKDIHKLHADADHQDVHSFYKDKKPLFKLFFGTFEKSKTQSIVVSFHLDLKHHEAIRWFVDIYKLENDVVIHDSYIEDDAGETYLGDDAEVIRDIFTSQEVLKDWLDTSSRQQIETYTKSKVIGRDREPNKSFDSQLEAGRAIIEFDKIKKPGNGEQVH